MTGPRIGSLFSGYGGLDLGVQAVLGGDVVWHSDIDKGSCKLLAHRYPDVPNLGDISKVDWSQVEPVDVLTGGFPCQDVSAAGKRAGLMHGTRSGLWHEFARAVAALRPSLVVIENVRGLLSARGDTSEEYEAAEARVQLIDNLTAWVDDRRTRALREGHPHAEALSTRAHRLVGLRRRAVAERRRCERRIVRAVGTVLGTLADLGYDAVWHGLRAADIGAPHGRFRVFIVAYPQRVGQQRWTCESFGVQESRVAPTPTWGGAVASPVTLLPTPAVNDMGEGKTVEAWDDWTGRMKAAHGNGNGHGASLAIEAQRLLPTPRTENNENRQSEGYAGDRGNFYGLLTGSVDWGDYGPAVARWEALTRPAPAPTMTSSKGNPQLAPAFVEWMMGLPAGWITDVPGLSRNEQLKLCGNGVVPQQAEAALRWLWPWVAASIAA